MRTTTTLTTLTALMLASSTAWACGPTGQELRNFFVIMMPLLTLPYALFGSVVIAARSNGWYNHGTRLRRWFVASLGAGLAATVGGWAAMAFALLELDIPNETSFAMVVSTPLVFEVAYLTWLGSRARRRRLQQHD